MRVCGSATSPIDDTWLAMRMPNCAEQLARQRAGGDAGCGLARAGALEHVADVFVAVLDGAGKIRMARTRPRDFGAPGSGCGLRHLALDVHRLLPVHPVAIANEHRDWRAGRSAVADAGEDLGAVALDGHAPPTAVAALPASELRVQRIDIDVESGGHAVKRDDERLAVRFARAEKSQHSHGIVYEEIAHSR